jgi:hypothetical protein
MASTTQKLNTFYFDLSVVFENDIIQAMARQTGWTDDNEQFPFEAWQLWAAKNDIQVEFNIVYQNINGELVYYIKSGHQNAKTIKKGAKRFTVPLAMCKDEFLSKIMKLCKIQSEDRYGRDAVIKYLIQCQLKGIKDYDVLYILIPEWDEEIADTNVNGIIND